MSRQMMWLVCQDGTLVNANQVVTIAYNKSGRYGNGSIVAFTADNGTVLCSGVTNEQAGKIMGRMQVWFTNAFFQCVKPFDVKDEARSVGIELKEEAGRD